MQHFWQEHRLKLLVAAVIALAIAARFEALQGPEATFLALGAPLVAVTVGLVPLRDSSHRLRLTAAVVGLVALVGSELELSHLFFPPDVLATATLSTKKPDAELEPTTHRELEVETHGTLAKTSGSAEESFVIELERDGAKRTIEGTFSKSAAVRFSRRRAPTSVSAHVVDVDRQSVELPGSGAIHAHLVNLTGAGAKSLELRLRPALPLAHPLELALKCLLALALVIQLAAARDGLRNRFLAWMGYAIVLALYLPRHFSPGDPLGALVGASFVALLVGGLGGWILGSVLSGMIGRRMEASAS